jgi:hypothetical protein
MLSKREKTEDAPIKTVPDANTEEAIDVEVARIKKEKQSVSGAFYDARSVRNAASDDPEDRERVEV